MEIGFIRQNKKTDKEYLLEMYKNEKDKFNIRYYHEEFREDIYNFYRLGIDVRDKKNNKIEYKKMVKKSKQILKNIEYKKSKGYLNRKYKIKENNINRIVEDELIF